MTAAFLCGCHPTYMGGAAMPPPPKPTVGSATWVNGSVTWQSVARDIQDVAVGENGLIVAGVHYGSSGVESTVIVSSDDGATWDQVNVAGLVSGYYQFVGAAYGDGLFMVSDITAGRPVFTSPDGITWTEAGTLNSYGTEPVWFGGQNWVAIGANGGYASGQNNLSTNNGASWTAVNPPSGYASNGSFGGVCYDGEQLIWLTNTSPSGTLGVGTSTDGEHWSITAFTHQGGQNMVAFGGGVYAAVGTSSVLVYAGDSPSALAAATGTQPTGATDLVGVAVTADGRIVVIDTGGHAYNSLDLGETWYKDTTSWSAAGASRIAANGTQVIATNVQTYPIVRPATCGC